MSSDEPHESDSGPGRPPKPGSPGFHFQGIPFYSSQIGVLITREEIERERGADWDRLAKLALDGSADFFDECGASGIGNLSWKLSSLAEWAQISSQEYENLRRLSDQCAKYEHEPGAKVWPLGPPGRHIVRIDPGPDDALDHGGAQARPLSPQELGNLRRFAAGNHPSLSRFMQAMASQGIYSGPLDCTLFMEGELDKAKDFPEYAPELRNTLYSLQAQEKYPNDDKLALKEVLSHPDLTETARKTYSESFQMAKAGSVGGCLLAAAALVVGLIVVL